MGIVCMCKRCAGTGAVFAGVKPFRFKRCPRCSGKGGKISPTPPSGQKEGWLRMEGWKTLNDGTRVKMERSEVDAVLDYIEKEDARLAGQYPDTNSCLRAFLDAEQRLQSIGWKSHVFDLVDGEELAVIERGSTGIFHAFWHKPYLHYHDCVSQQGKVWIKRLPDLTSQEREQMDRCSADHADFMDGQTKQMQGLAHIMGMPE